MSAAQAEAQDWYASLPGFPRLQVIDRTDSGDEKCNRVRIEYRGTPEDLIASGVATQDMLAMDGRRRDRVDAQGFLYQRMHYWRSTRDCVPCAPYRWFQVQRFRAARLAGQLPGATAAIAACRRHKLGPDEPSAVELGSAEILAEVEQALERARKPRGYAREVRS